MTRGIRLTGFLALALVSALVVFLSARDGAVAAPPFEPGYVTCFENADSTAECDGDSTAGSTSDLRTRFCVGWNADCSQLDSPVKDSNFGAVVSFVPNEWAIPAADAVPIGALAVRLESRAVLGLLNNPCSSGIQVAFTMMNASVNINDTIEPKPVGQTDVMAPLGQDADQNGIPDGADKYPKFLNTLFNDAQPRARLFGSTHIQGSYIALNFVFFERNSSLKIGQTEFTFKDELGFSSITVLQDPTVPAAPSAITDFCAPLWTSTVTLGKTLNNPCTGQRLEGANCPTAGTPIADRGFPLFPCETRNAADEDGDGKVNDGCPQVGPTAESGAQCDNNTSEDTEDTDINDGCPAVGEPEGFHVAGTCSGADEGGCNFRVNPGSGGDYQFTLLALSQRDADGDGIENGLDVCSLTPNGSWNPRAADPVNDPDGDGLPNECDPEPNVMGGGSPPICPSGYTGADQDQDCFANRADNCPVNNQLVNNVPDLTDSDSDGIGNACDPEPNAANGEFAGMCLAAPLSVGSAPRAVVGTALAEKAPDCAVGAIVTPSPGGTIQATFAPSTAGPGAQRTATPRTGVGGQGPGVGPASAGVGSLTPIESGVPAWAAIAALAGGAGLLAGLGLLAARAMRRREY